MGRILLFLAIGAMFSCAGNSGSSSNGTATSAYVLAPANLNALSSTSPLPSTTLKFFKLDMTPLTDPLTENNILFCTPDLTLCRSVCVSVYFPQVERYTMFKTDYINGNKCVAYALQYPDGNNVPKMQYFVGTYANSKCTIDSANPNFDGASLVNEVRVPDGQITPAPDHKRVYDVQSWFDSSGNPSTSIYLYNFRPPSSWDYTDSSVGPGYITPNLVNGFSCISKAQIQ